MKRYAGAILLLLLMPLLGGCWDRMEVNDLAIVDMVGVDSAESGVRLTVSVVAPARPQASAGTGGGGGEAEQGGGGGGAAVTYTAEGESIMNAMTKIQEKLSRRLFWAHTRVLVLGEAYARAGVRPALDFWSRHREPRLLMQIAVTPGEASEFLKSRPKLERLLSEAVRETINMRMQTAVTLKDFLGSISSDTEEPVAPRVALVPDEGGSQALVSGTAVFHDDRLIGWLSDAETRGLLWLRGEVATGIATVKVPSGGSVSMMLIRGSTAVRPEFRAGRLRMHAEFVAEDDVYESSATIDLGKDETVRVIQELLRQEVESRIRDTLKTVQQDFGVDIIKFGDVVRRNAPVQWEGGLKQRWPELFPTVPVDLVVTAHVRRTGEHSAPLSAEDRDIKAKPQEILKPRE